MSSIDAREMCVLIHSACSIEMKKKPVKDFFFHFLRKGRAHLLTNLKSFPII